MTADVVNYWSLPTGKLVHF